MSPAASALQMETSGLHVEDETQKRTTRRQSSFDEQLTMVGQFGRYQKAYLLICFSLLVFCLIHNVSSLFTFEERTFYCSSTGNMSQCDCPGEYIFVESEPLSAVSKYGLVCDKSNYVMYFRLGYAVGLFLGSSALGRLADLFGRKPGMLLSGLIVTVFGIAGPFMPNFELYTLMRSVNAMGVAGFINLAFVQLIECIGPAYRMRCSIVYSMGWSFGVIILGLFGYIFTNFIVFDAVSASAFGALAVIIAALMTESPYWQYNRDNSKEYKETMDKIAKMNGLKEIDPTILALREQKDEMEKCSVWSLFATWWTSYVTCLIWYMWLAVSFTSYTLTFHAVLGDKCLNLVVSGLIEFTMETLLLTVIHHIPRRVFCGCASLLATSSSAAAAFLLLYRGHPHDETSMMVLTLAARVVTSVNWGVLGLLTTETYPTGLRGFANGAANSICRVTLVASIFAGALSEGTILLCVCIVMLLSTVSTAFARETRGKGLPNTVEDYKRFCRPRSSNSPTA